MQKFSFHTHTCFSDGDDCIEKMLEQAVKLGWEEIGISDHLIVHENMQNSRSWKKWQDRPKVFWYDFDKIYDYFARNCDYIRKVSENYPLKVRIGAEVDYFTYSGWEEKFNKLREKLGLDYCITGNHFLFSDDKSSEIIDIYDIETFPEDTQEELIKRHLRTLSLAAESGLFDFMAHIDYMRKIEIFNRDIFAEEKSKMLKSLADKNMAVEISTKGLRKDGYFYPGIEMLKYLVDNNVKIVISDDAHNVEQLGYCFDYAEEVLKNLNCRNRWSYTEK